MDIFYVFVPRALPQGRVRGDTYLICTLPVWRPFFFMAPARRHISRAEPRQMKNMFLMVNTRFNLNYLMATQTNSPVSSS